MTLGIEILVGSNGMRVARINIGRFDATHSGSTACIFSGRWLSES